MTVDTFDSGSGTYNCAGDGTLVIEGWGGGGGGGEGDGGGSGVGGTGGGGGGYVKKTLAVTGADSFAWAVGAAGVGNTDGAHGCALGGNGGTTTIGGGTYTANGGSGGASCGDSGSKAGGTASGGDTNTSGDAGAAQSGNNGTAGGDSPLGGAGGAQVASGVNGNAGATPGGGGGGGGKNAFGANGGSGRVRFTFTPSSIPEVDYPTLILRPVSIFGSTVWDSADAEDIDDNVTQPGTGTDAVVIQSSGSSFRQQWNMEQPWKFPGANIKSAKIWIYAARATSHVPTIEEWGIGWGSTPSFTYASYSQSFTDAYAWYSYEWTGLSIDTADAFPKVSLKSQTGSGQVLFIDAMYLEITTDLKIGGGSVTGAGVLSGDGFFPVQLGSGSVTGGAGISGDGYSMPIGSGEISGGPGISGDGYSMPIGSGSVTGVVGASGAGLMSPAGSGAVSGVAWASGDGFAPPAHGSGSVTGGAGISGDGYSMPIGSGSVTGSGSLVGAGSDDTLRAHGLYCETVGVAESIVLTQLIARAVYVEVLGDNLIGPPVTERVLQVVVEVLGKLADPAVRREHEELFFSPWDSSRWF